MAVYTNITASEMAAFLEAQGFKPLALPVVRELTWGKRVDKGNLCLSLRVFTGINPTGQSRDKGKDAIHVVLMLRRQDGSIVKAGGDRRVHRVEGWRNNWQARIDKWDEDLTLCPTCGLPMVLRNGSKGKFLGCSGYPNCHTTKSLQPVQPHPQPHDNRGEGEIQDIEVVQVD